MQTPIALLAVLSLLTLAPSASPAAEGKKKNQGATKAPAVAADVSADVMARFDKNQNGILDSGERAEIRKAFAADASLKALDLNGDGRLDESELDKAEGGSTGKAKGKGKKK